MAQKSLILYSSVTGNTEKVALRFKKAFEKKGWECDMVKVDWKTDFENPGFEFDNYDFLCVGSPVILGLPMEEMIKVMVKNPASGHHGEPTVGELARWRLERNEPGYIPHPTGRPPRGKERPRPTGKIIPGPKKGVVFVTYGGIHLGPKEAAPALSLLEVEMEHLKFKCVGSFCCPGKHGNRPTPDWWHGDIRHRPNERDLLKAEIFMEEKIEEP